MYEQVPFALTFFVANNGGCCLFGWLVASLLAWLFGWLIMKENVQTILGSLILSVSIGSRWERSCWDQESMNLWNYKLPNCLVVPSLSKNMSIDVNWDSHSQKGLEKKKKNMKAPTFSTFPTLPFRPLVQSQSAFSGRHRLILAASSSWMKSASGPLLQWSPEAKRASLSFRSKPLKYQTLRSGSKDVHVLCFFASCLQVIGEYYHFSVRDVQGCFTIT